MRWDELTNPNDKLKMDAYKYEDQGPVFQSVVCFTSSLRVISLTVLADSI